jgi:tight adherence protein B
MTWVWVVGGSLFAGVGGGVAFALLRESRRRAQIAARLIPDSRPGEAVTIQEIARPASAGALLGLHFPQDGLPDWFRWLGANLRRAGFKLGSIDMLLFMTFGALLLGTAALLLVRSLHWTLLASAFGAYAAYGIVAFAASLRVTKAERQLADALDVIVGALEAGIGVRQSLEIVRAEMRAPIAAEFGEVLARMDLGVSPPEAFREMARLLRSKYIDLFVTTLAAKWDVGGNLSEMLRGLSRRIRESVRLQRRVRSLTAEARFSATILFAMPYALAVFMWLTNPDSLIYLFMHPLGRSLIEWAIALQILALIWISRILKFEH